MYPLRAFLVLVLVLLGTVQACAHAVLLETVPPDRAVVATSPDMMILRFNETVQPIAVELQGNTTGRIAADLVVVDHEIHLVPRAPLAAGSYFVSYRVASADSHPVAGSFLFAVGAAPAEWTVPALNIATYTGWTWAAAINRAFFLAAAFMAVGGLLFAFVVRRAQPVERVVVPAAQFGAVSAIIGIYLQGGVLMDAADAVPWNMEIWRIGLSSTRGAALIAAACGLFLCTARRVRFSLVGAAIVIASFAVSGHAATAMPHWIAIPTLLLHVGAVAFWLGSLAPLLFVLREAGTGRHGVFRRFSDFGTAIVPQLILAGIILAVLQIQRADAFFNSAYGLILALKLALVGLLLVIAICNRWILMPEMAENIAGHTGRFRRAIQGELALGFAILVVTAFLSQTVPPRSTLEHEVAAIDAARDTGQTVLVVAHDRKAVVAVTPARPGRNTIRVRILDNDDGVIDPMDVAVDLFNTDAGIEPLQRRLEGVADGYFELTGPELAVAGRWTIRIDALINDFEKAIFETEILVK